MVGSRSEMRLTRRQQKLAEKAAEKETSKIASINSLHFDIRNIEPATDNQVRVFQSYAKDYNPCLLGCAGTGKTFVSMFLALKEIADRSSARRKLVVIRSAQPSKAIGFLPGNEKQKMEVYERPYKAICSELYNRADAYQILSQKGIVEFESTSFLRGTTIDDAIILVDEIQNLSYVELRTVLTRVGANSRVILCGDVRQDDLTSERYKESSGLPTLIKVLQSMDSIAMVNFEPADIVRSGFCREFIEAEYELGIY